MIRESFRSVTCILLPLYARHVSDLPHCFPIDLVSAHCGSSLFTAVLALEVAEHSHTHDGPSRYVLRYFYGQPSTTLLKDVSK